MGSCTPRRTRSRRVSDGGVLTVLVSAVKERAVTTDPGIQRVIGHLAHSHDINPDAVLAMKLRISTKDKASKNFDVLTQNVVRIETLIWGFCPRGLCPEGMLS